MSDAEEAETYDLIDVETGRVVGRMRADGAVVAGGDRVRTLITEAFGRDLIVRDGEVIEELGVCFFDVETVRPGDPGHAAAVVRNLGALAGLLPRPRKGNG
jgi:hypothetical protein